MSVVFFFLLFIVLLVLPLHVLKVFHVCSLLEPKKGYLIEAPARRGDFLNRFLNSRIG